jgi:hypothetical protein
MTASTPQRSHKYSRSVIPTVGREDLGPPSPVGRFWRRENGGGGGGGGGVGEGRTHSRFHSL